ncbi:MAG: GAF domain-containing protein [Anaerolineaceae bacterium]|nr:MAG: GAF domain-containing protein [Anaerolineaceae bacterium]
MRIANSLPNFFNQPFRHGGLAGRIIWRLALATLIPLLLMSGAAYLRTRQLLEEQVVTQMQNLVTTEMDAAQNAMKIKQIRLDRIARLPDFVAAMDVILHEERGTPAFTEARNKVISTFEQINREEGNPIFNLYFVVSPDGLILASSERKWEGATLVDISRYQDILTADNQSFGIFDFLPFRPGQFSLVTINQFHTADGTVSAAIGGISEEQYAVSILKPIVDLTPSSRAYFVSHYGGYLGLDSYTGGIKSFLSVAGQRLELEEAFLPMMQPDAEFKPTTVKYENENGASVIAQAIWLEELKTGVVLEVPDASVFGHLNSLIPFTIAVFVGAFIAMGVIIIWSTNQVVKPILSLADTTSRFAQGYWQERASVKSDDEVGLLASSFNHMADQLSQMYQSLQEQVEERTRQIRTAAEVAQGITTSFNLNELLQTTVRLIVERFGFYHAGIFLIDSSGTRASLRAAHGPSAAEMLRRGHQLEVGSDSIVGWASSQLKPRVAADVDQDPVYRKNPLLPDTRAEAGFPIALGEVALGVLDVQSTEPHVFDEEMVIVLQTLANQIAAAIQNTTLSETTSMDASDAERLYRASPEIAQADSEETVLAAAAHVMKELPYPSVVVQLGAQGAEVVAVNNPIRQRGAIIGQKLNIKIEDIARQLQAPVLVNDLGKAEQLPVGLARPLREIGCKSGAFLPVLANGVPSALLLIGEQPNQPLTSEAIRLYAGLTGLLGATLQKVKALQDAQSRLTELDALTSFNQVALSSTDVKIFYATLQAQVQRVIGDYSFVVALYDEKTNSINIPYLYEEGKTQNIEPFPLGEGLTSILIRTRRPLLLVEDTEKQALALGAKIHGKPAKSWMGVPLLINEEPIGALIVQDLEREHCFGERDLRFLNEMGKQMAGVIQNVRLLNQSRQSALQLQTAAEIARDISSSLNLDELLLRGVNLIRDRFDFYHASIFLLDLHGEFAVIREATGEAGIQLKRIGHKLAVGSKSIVGYVSGQGENLVVNDTLKDATYYANPILPDTRSEAAIPLKVGERILGVLDVQSTQPYAFNEENLGTLTILADQLGVAVVNTELFAETQEHLSQHRLLHHITTSAASGSTLEDALDTTVRGLQVTLGGDRVSILLLDRERKVLEMRASMGYSEDAAAFRVPVGTGITGWAAAHRKPLRVDDVTKDPRYITVSENTRSELALPLIYRDELLGILNVESEQVAAYTENDEEMLGTLAGSLAAVIANARLLAQIRRQAERERLLYEVTSKIRRSTDMQTILATTAGELTRTIGARYTQIKVQPTPSSEINEETS